MLGKLIVALVFISQIAFCQSTEDTLNCSPYQDDIRLMSSLLDYSNSKIDKKNGFIFVDINNNRGVLTYSLLFSEKITDKYFEQYFDCFLFGNYIVVVTNGFDSPYIYRILNEKKKTIIPSNLIISLDDAPSKNDGFYQYLFVISNSRPFLIRKNYDLFAVSISIFKPIENIMIKFSNPMESEKRLKKKKR